MISARLLSCGSYPNRDEPNRQRKRDQPDRQPRAKMSKESPRPFPLSAKIMGTKLRTIVIKRHACRRRNTITTLYRAPCSKRQNTMVFELDIS